MGYDRGDVLARIPLASLCDELLDPHHGRGRTASWSCPDPGHGPQTGRTPPVTVFRPRSGIERWHCHACGAGGTAVDLVMVTQGVAFRDALELLARRAGAPEEPWRPATPRPQPPRHPEPARPARPDPALERYVAACEAWLWSPSGAPMRSWLADRRLDEEILRTNRVGADPAPVFSPVNTACLGVVPPWCSPCSTPMAGPSTSRLATSARTGASTTTPGGPCLRLAAPGRDARRRPDPP
jgi:DNA primase (bacterial type)